MLAMERGLLSLYEGVEPQKAGHLFERLVRKVLAELHPYWSHFFREVVPWREYARRMGLREKDTGIDLVGYGRNGELWGIQIKHWQRRVSWNDLGSFVGDLGVHGFQGGLVVAPLGVTKEAEDKLVRTRVVILTEEALLEGVDLSTLDPQSPESARRKGPPSLRPYQEEAVAKVVAGLSSEESRGKLVMPPGTGKTLVALRIAERLVGKGGTVLFLAPSIALLDQSIRAWEGSTLLPLRLFAVVSDRGVGREEESLDRLSLLHIPPTTEAKRLAQAASMPDPDALTVVFSTYQSVEVLEEAQKHHGLPPFDLVIMDEAHRTATVRGSADSPFTKVHHDDYVKGKRRLYMTATPRVWEVDEGSGAQGRRRTEADTPLFPSSEGDSPGESGLELLVYSMDDERVYGPTLYEYTFTQAVQEGYLTDYKLIVLAVTEETQKALAEYLQGRDALKVEEALKAVGLWKVLQGEVRDEGGEPMRLDIKRAIVFHGRVGESKALEREFNKVAEVAKDQGILSKAPKSVDIRHIDGQMSAYDRKALLDWLREDPPSGEIRVLTNAKVLTEGIDVPALDAVAFMRPRDSVVDVVQAVGRVMRKAPGKAYGYVILPVVVQGEDEEREIEESGYKTVYQVLSALRSVDKSFEARSRSALVSLMGRGMGEGSGTGSRGSVGIETGGTPVASVVIDALLEDNTFRQKVTQGLAGKLVRRLGMGRRYLETWAEDVARVAERLRKQVLAVVEANPEAAQKLEELLSALKAFVNESVTREDAVLMLVQHALTKPIFDALFAELEAKRDDPVSRALEGLFQEFKGFLERETEDLKDFYEEMRLRAQGLVDEAERADFLRRLYDGFFSRAFKDVADQMGIAYTPVELVDYLVKSADELARKHFGRGLASEGVYVLEPFAGTGTFVVRLLNYLGPEGARGKFGRKEIWANEILLLPYHVLKANVESAYLGLTGEYRPFEGAVLADSFRLAEIYYEKGTIPTIPLFPKEYGELLNRQIEDPIQVVLSNPPWRAWQEREGQGGRNVVYPRLRNRVGETYAARYWELEGTGSRGRRGNNLNSLYDLYIQALRMASDRIGEEGIVAFVTNNGWVGSKAARGLRKVLTEEFAEVYVYDLRGNARLKGEAWRKEGDKVFGESSRAGVAMVLLVKRKDQEGPGKVYRYRVGDYLTREAKLALVREHGSVGGTPWEEVSLEDWVGRRSEGFDRMVPLEAVFEVKSRGLESTRDAYAFNFSQSELLRHMGRLIETFNAHVERVKRGEITRENLEREIERDESLIKWSSSLKGKLFQERTYTLKDAGSVYRSHYRPFVPMWLFFSQTFNHRVGELFRMWPTPDAENVAVGITRARGDGVLALATNRVTSLDFLGGATYFFPLHTCESAQEGGLELTEGKRSNIRPEALKRFAEHLGEEVAPEDLFAYVYAVLAHPLYPERFAEDLRNELPRVPLPESLEDFHALVEAGRTLLWLHTRYEEVEPYPLDVEENPDAPQDPYERYRVAQLRLEIEERRLVYNDWVTVKNIPQEAFLWKPGGYSPLEWIVRFWKVEEKVAGPSERRIVWDPNLFLRERGNPRYLLDLVGKAVRVSVETIAVLEKVKPVVDRTLLGGNSDDSD